METGSRMTSEPGWQTRNLASYNANIQRHGSIRRIHYLRMHVNSSWSVGPGKSILTYTILNTTYTRYSIEKWFGCAEVDNYTPPSLAWQIPNTTYRYRPHHTLATFGVTGETTAASCRGLGARSCLPWRSTSSSTSACVR